MYKGLKSLGALSVLTILILATSGCGKESKAEYTTEELNLKATEYMIKGENREAAKWFLKSAKRGNAAAQAIMGIWYQDGLGVDKNPLLAEKWFSESASQGLISSQTSLGKMYRYGESPDIQEALRWFRKAAEGGDKEAQYELGMMYQEGKGIEQDYAKAEKWLMLAADQGNDDAKKKHASLAVKNRNKVPKEVASKPVAATSGLQSQLVGTWYCSNSKGYINKEVYKSNGTMDLYDTGYVPGVAGKKYVKTQKYTLNGRVLASGSSKTKISISGDTLRLKFQSGHGYSCEREF